MLEPLGLFDADKMFCLSLELLNFIMIGTAPDA